MNEKDTDILREVQRIRECTGGRWSDPPKGQDVTPEDVFHIVAERSKRKSAVDLRLENGG